jgi:tRNA-splicing ligase RtcB (3'-phosphate/5'-hydroxy nucleic acid ligase)
VTLMSASLDEAPMACKDSIEVMVAPNELVEALGRFDPKIVRMAHQTQWPED